MLMQADTPVRSVKPASSRPARAQDAARDVRQHIKRPATVVTLSGENPTAFLYQDYGTVHAMVHSRCKVDRSASMYVMAQAFEAVAFFVYNENVPMELS